MRIIIILLLLLFIGRSAFAQTPSKQEIQNQMTKVIKELNQQISELEKQIADAKKNKDGNETIKDLEDQLSMLKKQVEMMGGVTKGISKMSEKTVKQAAQELNNDENNSVPKRDDARIKLVPDKILTNAELIPYLKNLSAEIEKKISPLQLEQARLMYAAAKEKKQLDAISTLASLCWMNRYPELALYFASKACLDNMENTDNLNNLAAFLTMTGGEHLALPILQNLNNNFPNNSTILNNIGQAWYGLGDMNNSKQYLDKAVRIYRVHPQANKTKTSIQKSENNTQETIESLKRAIKEDFSPEDEIELDKRGYHVKYEDIGFKYPIKAQPLGIERFMFIIPAYPMEGGVVAEVSKREWGDFREKVSTMYLKLDAEKKVLDINAKNYGDKILANPLLLMPYNNKICITAGRKYTLLVSEWATDRVVALDKRTKASADSISKWKDDYHRDLAACAKRHENDATPDAFCQEAKALATAFNSKANTVWQARNNEWLLFQKEFLNARSNLTLYASKGVPLYEQDLNNVKMEFLNYLQHMPCEFEIGCIPQKNIPNPTGKILPDYDSLNCKYKTELSIPCYEKLFSIKVECNRMTTAFDLPFIKAEMTERLNTNKMLDIVNGSVEISAGASKDISMKGPLSGEMEVKVKAFVEIKNNQVSDVGIEGELSGSIKNQSDQKLEAGVNVRTSWNAGTTVSGTGLFGGSKVSFK